MTIVNKRNAVVGYVTLKVGKKVARKKAKQLTNWRPGNNNKNGKNSKKSD
jgi:hypothetical protein